MATLTSPSYFLQEWDWQYTGIVCTAGSDEVLCVKDLLEVHTRSVTHSVDAQILLSVLQAQSSLWPIGQRVLHYSAFVYIHICIDITLHEIQFRFQIPSRSIPLHFIYLHKTGPHYTSHFISVHSHLLRRSRYIT